MNKEKIGLLLIELRKEKNLLQSDVATIFNVTPQAVSKWERGESLPDIEIIENICKYYNITFDELMNGTRKDNIENTSSRTEDKDSIENTSSRTKDKDSAKKTDAYASLLDTPFKEIKNNKKFPMLIYLIASVFIFLIVGFLPFVKLQIITSNEGIWGTTTLTVYQTFSYYNVLFSNNYKIGNYFVLISFMLGIAAICVSVCVLLVRNKNHVKRLNFARIILSTCYSCSIILVLFIIIGNAQPFAYIMALLALTNIVLLFVLKFNRNSYILSLDK